MKGMLSVFELPDSDDAVLLLLWDVDRVDMLDSDPDVDLSEVRPVFEERPDLAERPDSDVLSDLEEMSDTSEMSNLEDSSEMEDTLVLEVILDAVDRAVVDLVFSGSGSFWILIILEVEKDTSKMVKVIKLLYWSRSIKCWDVSRILVPVAPTDWAFFWLSISLPVKTNDSRFLPSTEGCTHRPQVEETTSRVKGWAHPAEEQRRAEVKPVGVPAVAQLSPPHQVIF